MWIISAMWILAVNVDCPWQCGLSRLSLSMWINYVNVDYRGFCQCGLSLPMWVTVALSMWIIAVNVD